MPLVYRAVLDDADGQIVRQVEPLFASWMHQKSLVAEDFSFVPSMSTALASSEQPAWVQRRTVSLGAGAGHLHRIRLVEESVDSRWTTTVMWTTAPPEQQALAVDPAAPQQLSAWDMLPPSVGSWVWIDLEHEPVSGPSMRPGSPRLVRDLMAAGEAHDGQLPLTAEALVVTAGHVKELIRFIADPARQVPIAVFAHDPQRAYDQDRLAQRLARDLAGVAAVFRLANGEATAAFAAVLPPGYEVYGGALRTYLPQATLSGDIPTRHRVLGRTSIKALGSRAFPAVKDQILNLSTQRSAPLDVALVRRLLAEPAGRSVAGRSSRVKGSSAALNWFSRQVVRIRSALGDRPASAPDYGTEADARQALTAAIDDLLRRPQTSPEDVVESEQVEVPALRAQLAETEAERELLAQLFEESASEASAASQELRALRDDAEFAQLELLEAIREGEAVRRRARWLERRVRELGEAGWEVPADVVDVPNSVAEVLVFARQRLEHIAVGPTDAVAAELDVHPGVELFAAKTWDALLALNDYAAAVRSGTYSGNFHLWCQQQPAGASAVSATAVALAESESVNEHPQLRGKRTFSVPAEVAAEGRAYMPAHIKIVKRGSPAPRLHFHDDTRGQTGLVHIGYVGAHLPTAQFK